MECDEKLSGPLQRGCHDPLGVLGQQTAGVQGEKGRVGCKSLTGSVDPTVKPKQKFVAGLLTRRQFSCPEMFLQGIPLVKKKEGSSYPMWSSCTVFICFRTPSVHLSL